MSTARVDRGAPPPERARARELNLLVVDDSAVMRQMIPLLLASEDDIVVATAADPLIAWRKIQRRHPDVILLDLAMPRMDGLTFLRRLMAADPIPVIVCSGIAGPGTEAAVTALEEGAVDVIVKPSATRSGPGAVRADAIVDAVRAAALARVRPRAAGAVGRRGAERASPASGAAPAPHDSPLPLIAIGASTGGTDALRLLLAEMPPTSPAAVIVQHMPAPFTAAFARRLNAMSSVEVREAVDGTPLRRGLALIAPGGRHLLVARAGSGFVARLADGDPVSRHRPSVDVLFQSVARAAGRHAIGALLTGMGRDGAEGLLAMREAGAATLVQDEATSTVFGMPRAALECGAATSTVPLEQLADAITRLATPAPYRAVNR